MPDPEGQLLVPGRAWPEELLALGEVVEAGAGLASAIWT